MSKTSAENSKPLSKFGEAIDWVVKFIDLPKSHRKTLLMGLLVGGVTVAAVLYEMGMFESKAAAKSPSTSVSSTTNQPSRDNAVQVSSPGGESNTQEDSPAAQQQHSEGDQSPQQSAGAGNPIQVVNENKGDGSPTQIGQVNGNVDSRKIQVDGNYIEHKPEPPPSPRKVARDALNNLRTKARELQRLKEQRADATVRSAQAAGHIHGKEAFSGIARQRVSRFDERESNKALGAFDSQLAQAMAERRKVIADSDMEVKQFDASFRENEQAFDLALSQLRALIGEFPSGQESQRVVGDIKRFADLSAAILSKCDEIAAARVAEARAEGIIAGATNHQRLWFDIHYGMDREEAVWSRSGGERRAPAGGYERAVNDRVVATARNDLQSAKARQDEIKKTYDSLRTELDDLHADMADNVIDLAARGE
jgi:hypothetical protein